MDTAVEVKYAVPSGLRLIRTIFLVKLVVLSYGSSMRAEPRDSLEAMLIDNTSDSQATPDNGGTKRDAAIPAAVRDKLRAKHHPERLLVRFRPGRGQAKRRAIHQMARAKRVVTSFRHVDGLELVEVGARDLAASLAAYSGSPDVLYAEPDYTVRAGDLPNDPSFDQLWGLYNTGQTVSGDPGTAGADIRALQAWNFWTGDPDFRIAVIDTGVNYEHPDLAGNIWTNPGEIPGNGIDDDGNGWVDDVHGYDIMHNDGDPMDDNRHGSHVAGTIGAVPNNNVGVVGINWYCSIVGLKFLSAGGSGSTSDAVKAMEYVIDNGIRVSNNSWGGGGFSQALYDVIEASQDVGHIFVAASGNSGTNTDYGEHYPSSYNLPNIISVAATDNDDNLAYFSNYGPDTVDLGAPGVKILSSVLGTEYAYFNGTSMAAPHVTGVVALLTSRQPDWTWQQVKDRVLGSVRPVDSLLGITVTGGIVSALNVGDCNENGIADEDDIAGGTSQDCSGNGTPDECEPDCNGNGAADSCDILDGTSANCNGNTIPDECEPDCNNNSIADSCDITAGTSADCNANAIPDECEVAQSDCNTNGIPDDCDISSHTSQDCNRNRKPDECDVAFGWAEDCNTNGVPDSCDIVYGVSTDCDANEVPDDCQDTSADCNNTNVWDMCDIAVGLSADCDGNGIPDECMDPGDPGEDCNNNARPDLCEPDCNNNLIPDDCDIAEGSSQDCTANAVPDECEPDCNTNSVADSCDIADGTSSDLNGNSVPDECEVIVYVDADAFGANDGTTWLDAFNDLQHGLDFAADPANGVTGIWVAEGVYTPDRGNGDPEATFQIVSGVLMYGGFAGKESRLGERDPALHEVVLSGDLLGDDDPPRGFGTSSCCDGFPPTSCDDAACAQAVCEEWPVSCCDGNWTEVCAIVALTICCDLCGNRCDNSHHVVTASGTNHATLLDGFTITSGRSIGPGYLGSGGGILNLGGNLTVNNCRIVGNTGNSGGGGMTNWIYANGAVSNSVFMGNSAPIGGGMANANSSPAVTNCMFIQNLGVMGGGMDNMEYLSRPVVANCIFSGNAAGNGGGVHSAFEGLSPLINCVFVGNTAYKRGGGVFVHSGQLPITNSILWGNTDSDGTGDSSQVYGFNPAIHFSCVQGWSGWYGGIGNSGDDPLFVDADGADDVLGTEDDDLHLSPTSPYLDAGNNVAVPPEVTTDFDGGARFVQLPDIPDTGNGFPPIVDLGVYEAGSDCNGNGVADENDIADGTSTDCNANTVPDECEPDCNANGIPDECEPDEDCNSNGIQDICDISSGVSEDCNLTLVPDECELLENDCNANAVPDDCEGDCNENGTPDSCDITSATSEDCTDNGIPDECEPDCNVNGAADSCDIADNSSEDLNLDGIPDECVLMPTPAPWPHDARKNRYISFDPNNTGRTVAFQVEITYCYEFPTTTGVLGWVSEPDANDVSRLVDSSYYSDAWPDAVHVGDCGIVPVATYEIRAADDGAIFSDPLEIGTILKPGVRYYGDMVGMGIGDLPPLPGFTPPNRVVNVTDVQAFTLTLQGTSSPSAHVTWVDLHGMGNGSPPNFILNVSDLQRIMFGIEGLAYADTPEQLDPSDCP